MNYKKHYELLVRKGKSRDVTELDYYERHHIIPKSEGGSDEESNIVCLTAREHFVAHWLLYRDNPAIHTRAFSFWRMCNGGNTPTKRGEVIVTSRCYEEGRVAHSKSISAVLAGKKKSNSHVAKVADANRGKRRTEQQKDRMRKPHKMSDEGLKVIRDIRLGKSPTNVRSVEMLTLEGAFIKSFKSLREAADYVGLVNSNIYVAAKGGKTSGGYKWRFVEENKLGQ